MAINIHGDKSLMFKTGVDTSGLRQGTQKAKGILGGLKKFAMQLGIFAGITVALRKLKREVFDFAQDFKSAMIEVQTISDAVTKNFDQFSDQIAEMSTTVPDNATKLSQAFYQIVSAGYDGAKGMELLETAAKTATAGITDTKTAADLMTSAMTSWKIESSKAEDVADKLFTTVRRGKTTLDDMAGKLGEVASAAAPMGITIDEVLGSVQTLTKMGVPVAQAMQRIRAGIRDFSREFGGDWAETMSLQEKAIQVFQDAEGDFKEVLEVMSEEGAQFVNILGSNVDMAREDLASFEKDAGAMSTAFGKAMEDNRTKSKILADNIRTTLLPVGQALDGIWGSILTSLNSLFESTEDRINQVDREKSKYEENINTLEDLFQKYEELSNKTNKSKEEKEELYQVINDIAEFMPEAVKQWDAERGAIELNTKAVEENIKRMKDALGWRKAEIEQIQNFMKDQEQRAKLRGREPIVKPIGELTEGTDITLTEYNIEAIRRRREEITKELNQLSERERLTEEQSERVAILRDRLKGLNKQLEQHNEQLEELNEKDKENIKNKKEKIEVLDIEYKKLDSQSGILKGIENQIKALNQASDTYNKAERKRIKQQIELWTNLYTAIAEARRMGYFDWSQRQADETLRQMTGNNGLMPMRQATPNDKQDAGFAKFMDNFSENIKDLNTQFYRLSNTVGELDTELGRTIGNISNLISGLTNTIGGLQRSAKDGTTNKIIGSLQAFGGILSIVSSINSTIKAISGQNKGIQNEIRTSNIILENQLKELRRQTGVEKARSLESAIEANRAEAQKYYDKMARVIENWGGDPSKKVMRELYEKALSEETVWEEKWVNWYEQFDKADQRAQELADRYQKYMTGATNDGVASGFTTALKEGKSFTQAFKENFESSMRSAIVEAFKRKYLMQPIKEWMSSFAEASQEGLTSKEINQLRSGLKDRLEGAESEWQDIQNMLKNMGMTDGGGAESLKGAIRGVTEKTAGLIAGRLHGIHMHVAESTQIISSQLAVLNNIEKNTFYNKRIYEFITTEESGVRSLGG